MKIPIDMIKRVIDNFNTRVGAVIRRKVPDRTYHQLLKNREVSSFHVLSDLEDIISHHAGIIWQKNFHDMLFE